MARAAAPMFSGFRDRTSTTRKRSNSGRIAGLNSSSIVRYVPRNVTTITLQNPAERVYARTPPCLCLQPDVIILRSSRGHNRELLKDRVLTQHIKTGQRGFNRIPLFG